MTVIDTNVLVRYLVQDDPVQSGLVNGFMESLSRSKPGYVPLLVLAELHWVLTGAYGIDRSVVVQLIDGLTRTDELVLESAPAVARAVQLAAEGADLADALILQQGVRNGGSGMVTLDRHAARMPGVTLLGA